MQFNNDDLVDLIFGILALTWVVFVLKEGKFTLTYPFGKGRREVSQYRKWFLYWAQILIVLIIGVGMIYRGIM